MSKRLMTLSVAVATALGAAFAHAAVVEQELAMSAASGFLSNSSVAKRVLAGRSVESVEQRGSLWIVHLAPSGYIEVAGSTKCAPILSFSSQDFAEPEVGSPLVAKLSADNLMIEKKEADESLEDNADWAKYTAPVTKKRMLLAAKPTGTDSTGYDPYVAPLLGATWNQTAPFNDLSPYNYFCGCMATAAGQELRYWRWPYRYEKFRQSTHGVRDAQLNYSDFVIRPNGLVPFNWDKVVASAPNPASTPWAADKEATYNTAWLSLWAQSLTGMGYKPGGSGGTRQLAGTAEEYWYESGRGYTYWNDGYDALWAAVKADLDWGSPIQINTAAHQMVIDGYAVENNGTEDEVDWINLNLGYGNAVYWENLKTAVTEGTYSGVLASFQTGFRPQKIVQFEPVPKVSGTSLTLAWHIAPCYTNRISGFYLQTYKDGNMVGGAPVLSQNERTEYTATDLATGSEYTFTVKPLMSDASEARPNSVKTTIGTPQPAPEFLSVSSVACGIELLQQDIFIECAYGSVNKIDLTCSESTTEVVPYSSHLTILPDEKLSVAKSGNVFTVNVDATAMDPKWSGEMLVLTLVAKNGDGTEAYKNLMLRFNSMRQVINGTFDAAEGDSDSAVWFCGDTTIDAKGRAVSFGASAFQGTGKVTLTDSVGGGSFTFQGLGGFSGTLHLTDKVDAVLPNDMSNFRGTLEYDYPTDHDWKTYHYTISRDLPATAKIRVPNAVMLYIDSAIIDAALLGSGAVYIVDGSSSLHNTKDFTGRIHVGDGVSTQKLTLLAGQEKNVSIWSGTLYLTLNSAQVAYGYSTDQINDFQEPIPGLDGGRLVFQNEKGEILAEWTAQNSTYTYAATANTWTPDSTTNSGRFSDPERWSFGRLPVDGEYVLINATYMYGPITNTLDLVEDLHLGYVRVVSVGGVATAVLTATDNTATLYVDTFENTVSTTVCTDKLQPNIVIPQRTLNLAEGIVVDCEIDYSIAPNLHTATGVNALPYSNYWKGTVTFNDCTFSAYNTIYGNAISKLLFTGATGKIYYETPIESEVILQDLNDSPAWHWNGGYTTQSPVINKLSGNGTLKTSSAIAETVLIKDVSDFNGSFDLAAKTIAIADSAPSSNIGNNGCLHICKATTIASGKTWMANGGLYLGTGGSLTVNGEFATGSGIVTYGNGATLTIEDGASVKVAQVMSGDYVATLNFKAGTYKFASSSDITETRTVNFCAGDGKCTTLDAGGRKITLGQSFFSGSGDVYLTSSASGGSFVIQGLSSEFTGTIYADISAGVTIAGDISQSSGKISLSDISLTVPSSNLGNFEIGSGATLAVTVSKSHLMSGLEIDSVTLVDGGTLVLRDKDGKELEYTTSDGKYILEGDSTVTAECLLDYEFNGNKQSTGTDKNTLNGGGTFNSEKTALYMNSQPWISNTFAMPDDEWTSVMRCTLPVANSDKPTIVIMYGVNGGNLFGLVAGTEENTVALASGTGIIGEAVAVENATTKYHVYTIVKTSGRVKLYVDGELKVNEAATVSVTKKFQIGSVHGSNNTSYNSCTDANALIDYLKFYDFAVGEKFEEMVYSGPKPIAVWDGDFSPSELTKFTGCGLIDGQNTHGENNSSVTIDQDNQGLIFCSSNGLSGITVLVRYSDLQAGTDNKRVLFTSTIKDDYTGTRTGIRLASGSAGTLRGLWGNGDWPDNRNPESGSVTASGVMAFAYSSAGTYLYNGSSVADLTEAWKCTSLMAADDTNKSQIRGAGIGGYCSGVSTNGYEAAKGMTITGIAVFDSALSASVLADYQWPSEEPEEPEPTLTVSPEQGAVDWGTELTASCDDSTATIWYKKLEDEDYTQYAEPVILNVPGINYYYIQVRDANGKVVVADNEPLTYLVGNPPEVTFTVEVPDNMTVTVDGEAYKAGDELTRTVGASVTIDYTVTGAYVGETQSQTVEITADTTIIETPPNYVEPVAAVAQIVDGSYYATLQDAVAAATASAAETVEISLLLASDEDVNLATKITVVESEAGQYTGTLSGSGTLVLAGTRTSAMSFGEWTGTVVLPEIDGIAGNTFSLNYYGVEGSTARINGIGGGWLRNEIVNPTIDIPAGKTLTISDFSASFANTFKALSGSGTLSLTYSTELNTTAANWYSNYSAYFLLKDVTGFTGSLTTVAPGIAIGDAKPGYQTSGGRILLTSANATLAATASPTPETTVAGSYVKQVEGVYSVETYKTITFKNEDGTTLYTITDAKLGDTPEYVGTTPTKAETEQYTYIFNTWNPEIAAVTGNAEYTATYTPTPIEVIPSLPENPTFTDVTTAITQAGFTDTGVATIITGAENQMQEYNSFKTWAEDVIGDAAAVVASAHAADSYLLGMETLLQHEPKVTIAAFDTGDTSSPMTLSVTVTDGGTPVGVTPEKVAALIKATKDLSDWDGEGKLTPTLSVQDNKITVSLTGTEPVMFLKIKK